MEQEIPIRPVFTEPPYSGLIADLYETSDGDAYVIEIPVPGLKRDEIVVKANNYSLSVAAEPQPEPSAGRKYIKREGSLLPMSRIFEFPMEINTNNVQASLENGILRIHVPKAPPVRRKLIRVDKAA
jgi:HSP20 family protein